MTVWKGRLNKTRVRLPLPFGVVVVVFLWAPSGSLWLLLVPFWFQVAPFWASVGSLWAPFGSLWLPLATSSFPLAPFFLLAFRWFLFGSLVAPCCSLGVTFAYLWLLVGFLKRKLAVSNSLVRMTISNKQNLARDSIFMSQPWITVVVFLKTSQISWGWSVCVVK